MQTSQGSRAGGPACWEGRDGEMLMGSRGCVASSEGEASLDTAWTSLGAAGTPPTTGSPTILATKSSCLHGHTSPVCAIVCCAPLQQLALSGQEVSLVRQMLLVSHQVSLTGQATLLPDTLCGGADNGPAASSLENCSWQMEPVLPKRRHIFPLAADRQ